MTDLAQVAAWHRRISAIVEAADRAGVAGAELPGIRARLHTQQLRLTDRAARDGAVLPALAPTPGEVATEASILGDFSAAAVAQAVHAIDADLSRIDAALDTGTPSTPTGLPLTPVTTATPSAPPSAPVLTGPAPNPVGLPATGERRAARPATPAIDRWSPSARNTLIYGGFAFAVLAAQVIMLLTLDEERVLPLLAPVCLVVLPAFAWAAGWLTIGIAFRPAAHRVDRTPRLGVVICLLPNLVLCAGVGLLYLAS